MDNDETEDSIEEISLDRKTVFGNKNNPCHADLMKGIVVNIRIGGINTTHITSTTVFYECVI